MATITGIYMITNLKNGKRYIIPMTDDAKLKMSFSKKNKPAFWRYKSVVRSDGKVFESIKSAALAISATPGGVLRVCKGQRKYIYGYSFSYVSGGVPSQR